jgi:hypothetical protein
MQPIYFSKAGKFKLRKYKNGVKSTDPADTYFRNGAIQSIQPTINIKTTALPDGNSDWDAAEPDTGKEGSVAVNFSFMPIDLYAFIMGTTVEDLVDTPMPVIDYEISIPEASPFVVTLPHAPDTSRQIILVDSDASAWAKTASVSAVPAAGQYTISAVAATFNSADAGKPIFITYDWIATAAKSFGLSKSGSREAMELTISDEATGEDESTIYDSALIVDKCKATGNINPPEQGREPKPASITFKVLKPSGNNKAVDYKFAKRE